MKKKLLLKLISLLLGAVSEEMLRKLVDALLDKAEDAVTASPNKIDDAIVLPLCSAIRSTFNIPDND